MRKPSSSRISRDARNLDLRGNYRPTSKDRWKSRRSMITYIKSSSEGTMYSSRDNSFVAIMDFGSEMFRARNVGNLLSSSSRSKQPVVFASIRSKNDWGERKTTINQSVNRIVNKQCHLSCEWESQDKNNAHFATVIHRLVDVDAESDLLIRRSVLSNISFIITRTSRCWKSGDFAEYYDLMEKMRCHPSLARPCKTQERHTHTKMIGVRKKERGRKENVGPTRLLFSIEKRRRRRRVPRTCPWKRIFDLPIQSLLSM